MKAHEALGYLADLGLSPLLEFNHREACSRAYDVVLSTLKAMTLPEPERTAAIKKALQLDD